MSLHMILYISCGNETSALRGQLYCLMWLLEVLIYKNEAIFTAHA